MRLERDEGRLCANLVSRVNRVTDDVQVTAVHAVEAADGERDRADVGGRESEVDPQVNTFSGTNVRRSGSVWPSATSRPSAS